MFTFFSWLFTNQISQLFVYKILFCLLLLLYKYTYNLKRILSVCFHILVRMIYIISNICELLPPWIYEFWTTTYNYTMANKKSNLLYQNVSFIIWNTTMIKSMLHNFTQRSNMKGKKIYSTIFDGWLWFYCLHRKKNIHTFLAIHTVHIILPIEKSIYILLLLVKDKVLLSTIEIEIIMRY